MTRQAPTFVADYPSADFTGTSTPKTKSVTVATGDVLVAVAGRENTNAALATPTGGSSVTWNLEQSQTTGNFGGEKLFTSSPSSQTFTFSEGSGGSSGSAEWGFDVLRFSGTDGKGASNKATGTTGGSSVSLTTTADNSAIVCIVTDWNSVDGASRVWRTINGITPTAGNGLERIYQRTAGIYTVYVAYWSDVGAAGAKTVGFSTPSSGVNWSILAVEVKGEAATGVTGTGSIALKKPALSVSATEKETGTGSVALKKPSISIAAKEKYNLSGSAALKKPALSLAGKPKYILTGGVGLKKPSLSVSGFEEESGTGSVALKKPALSASGKPRYLITGSVALKKPALSESGTEKISGTGSIGLKKPSLSGTNILSLRLYPNTDGPANGNPGDDTQYVFGLSFKVTTTGYQLDGWWHWVASDQDQTAQDFALWEVGVGYVASSKVTSGAFTQNAWNFVACNTPIPLTNGTEYRAVRSVNKDNLSGGIYYSLTGHYFDSGAGSDGITNGALVAFNAPGGGTNPEPASAGQMVFNSSGSDVTTLFPTGEFNESNYWLDVQVSVAGITGVSGTGSIALKKPSLSVSAVEHISGSGSVSLKKPAISIAAKEKYNLSGSVGLKKPALSGSGPAEKISATGSITLKKPALALVGRVPFILTGGVGLKKPALSASGGWTFKNTARGQSSGTTATTGNTGGTSGPAFDAIQIAGSGGSLTFDNTHPLHGHNAYKIVVPATNANTILEWTTSLTGSSLLQTWLAGYFYLTANPGSTLRCLRALSGTTLRGAIAINSSGKVLVLDASGTIKGTSTASVPLNQWFRLEGYVIGDASVGRIEAKLFSTADALSPDETVTSAINQNTGGTINRVDGGNPTSLGSYTFWMVIGASPLGYVGPFANAGPGSVSLKKPSIQLSGTKVVGTVSMGLKKPALSASGPAEKISGTGSASLKKPSIAISASEKISGTGSASLKKPSIAISAQEKFSATGSVSLKKPSLSGSAREIITGTGSCGLKKPQLTISAKEREAATGSISLKKPSLSGSGTASYHVSGTGSIGLKKPVLSLTGDESISGTGSIHMKKMRIEAHEFSIPANALFAMWPV